MSNWRDLLRLQQEELGLIPKSSNNIQGASGVEEKKASIEYAKRKTQSKSVSIADETEKKAIGSRQLSKSLRSNVITTINSMKIPLVSDEIDASLDLIETQPDATQRYQTARMKLLSQQIREGDETRRYLAEEATDLRRQLKAEREDSMGLKKRYIYKGY